MDPEDAHHSEAWEWGTGWTRQPGDLCYYGTPRCHWCTADKLCLLCAYTAGKGLSPESLVTTGPEWIDGEMDQPWGGRDWERRQLVRHGLLDCVEDPEAGPNGGGANHKGDNDGWFMVMKSAGARN